MTIVRICLECGRLDLRARWDSIEAAEEAVDRDLLDEVPKWLCLWADREPIEFDEPRHDPTGAEACYQLVVYETLEEVSEERYANSYLDRDHPDPRYPAYKT